jgi:DNA repair protein RadA/Sms
LPRDTVFFGEISLSGDVRPVPQAEARLKEAAKLGFKRAFIPKGTKVEGAGLKLSEVSSVTDLLAFAPDRTAKRAPPGKVTLSD